MNEMVKSLWEDTNNLQDYTAKVMALARANKATTAKTLKSITSLQATAAALATAANVLIPVVRRQGALLQDMQQDHVIFLAGYVAPPHVNGLTMQYHDGGVTVRLHQATANHWQHPPPHDVSDHAAFPSGGGNLYQH
jgi:hypothetical protein